MKLGKYSAYLLVFFFLQINQSFGEATSSIEIDSLSELPSTYEEEEFVEDENTSKQVLQKVKYDENKKTDGSIITVEIKALDKITAKTSAMKLAIGEKKFFGVLEIKALKCQFSQKDDTIDTVAYLQVKDLSAKDNNQVFLVNGWTFASSPTLQSIDHPVYDLWITGCENI